MTQPSQDNGAPRRLLEGEGSPAVQRLLRQLPEPQEPAWARERVRARLFRPRPRLSVLKLGAVAAVLLVVGVGLWVGRRPLAQAPSLATLVLASGEVSLAGEGAPWQHAAAGAALAPHGRVRTGEGGRALARFSDAAALFGGRTVATLGNPPAGSGLAINLLQGSVAVTAEKRSQETPLLVLAEAYTVRVVGTVFSVDVADDRAVEVRVAEGTVVVTGPQGEVRVPAGQSWSSRSGGGHASLPPADVALLAHLGRGPVRTTPLLVEGPAGVEVSLDGVALGRMPLQFLAAPGAGTLEGAGTRQALQVAEGRATHVRLQPPPGRGEGEAAPAAAAPSPSEPPPSPVEEKLAAAPPKPAPKTKATTPPTVAPPHESPAPPEAPAAQDAVAALRARLAAATSPEEREALTYALARELARRGGHAEAVELFAQVAAGGGSRAEVGLYEVGRLRARFLQQPKGAIEAFGEYLRRFPSGALVPEVLLSLAELHMQAGALEKAEPLLGTFLSQYATHARHEEVRLLRGHVRRERGDCAGALADYSPLRTGSGAHAEAALYFSAVCAQRGGQATEARPLLEDYLQRFPQGPHRTEVEHALGREATP